MKKAGILFLLAILLGVSAIVYKHYTLMAINTELELQTDVIAQAYHSLVSENVLPLIQGGTLTQRQQELASKAIETQTALQEKATSIIDAVDRISAAQKAVTAFAASLGENQSEDPRVLTLQKETGEDGDVRSLLSSYNTLMLRWNAATQDSLASMTASITGNAATMLPYLEFDGEQDYAPEVKL